MYVPVNGRGKKTKIKMKRFWLDLDKCLRSFGNGRRLSTFGDMNVEVGSVEVENTIMECDVDGLNENGRWADLEDVCFERAFFLANTFSPLCLIPRQS